MAVSADKTIILSMEEMGADDMVEAADFTDLMSRTNANEEMITDAAAEGAAGRTYRGHDHDPGSAGTPGRGIRRIVDGGFQISAGPMVLSCSTAFPVSIATAAAYANMYEAAGSPNALNYKMGKVYVSPGLTTVQVEVCAKVDAVKGKPRIRCKNLTDSTADTTVASNWIYIDTTTPAWYGSTVDVQMLVPVTRATSQKEVDLDLEVSVEDYNGTAVSFSLYAAFPFEPTDEV